MRVLLNNLNGALVYQLRGLYDAEKKLLKALPKWLEKIDDKNLKSIIDEYMESIERKLLKLEYAFEYLAEEPGCRKGEILDQILEEAQETLRLVSSNEMYDVMLIVYLQSVTHYKIAMCGTTHSFAMQLKIHTVSDILHEILEWEKETDWSLTRIAIEKLNEKACGREVVF